jgi:N-acetylneuraminic acid mutarotase
MDMSILFETGKADKLRWRERKMKDNTFLTRWGHTSEVYEDKIYVFGGRFCNDLNDILVLDPMKDQINTLKVQGDLPKARRRHSACFLGSSMLIFGGFNGEYFNDLYYINIANGKKKITAASIVTLEKIE